VRAGCAHSCRSRPDRGATGAVRILLPPGTNDGEAVQAAKGEPQVKHSSTKIVVASLGASLLLAVAPARADVESETRVEQHVEHESDADLDSRRTERSVEVEREGTLGTTSKRVESTTEKSMDDGEVEVEKHTEKTTTVDD